MPIGYSGRGAQSGERDGYPPMDGSFGRETTCRRDRVQAVGRELVGRDIGSRVARGDRVGDACAHYLAKVALGARDMLVAVERGRELGVVMAMGSVGDQGVRLEHRGTSLRGPDRVVSRGDEELDGH